MPHLWTLGLNHDTAALDLRARFAVDGSDLGHQLQALAATAFGSPQDGEVALLSTCNRTEIYGASDSAQAAQSHLAHARQWLKQLGGVTDAQIAQHLYVKEGVQSIGHALRVASGLESMVLGETQILGQMKDAVRAAQEASTLGTNLHHLFQKTFSVAKAVRANTGLGAQTVSLAAAATKLCADVFEDWAHTKVLMIGAGEMIELCAAHFAAKKPARLCIANRTLERGAALAKRFGTQALPIETITLGEIPSQLSDFDVVLSCTASTLPIIGLGVVQSAIKLRKHRPMVMIDLAVPRDIEPQVKALSDVYLYTVDDLGAVVQTGKAQRALAAQEAQVLIDAGVTQVMERLQNAGAVNKIQALQEQSNLWQTEEIDKIKTRLKNALDKGFVNADEFESALQSLAKSLSAKFMHQAITKIKSDE